MMHLAGVDLTHGVMEYMKVEHVEQSECHDDAVVDAAKATS